jgi:hypothetical protein
MADGQWPMGNRQLAIGEERLFPLPIGHQRIADSPISRLPIADPSIAD